MIHYLLKGIKANIPKLIIDYKVFEHLLIPSRHLPFGRLITRLLKQLKFDLSVEWSIEPSVDINYTLLKWMRSRERAPAPQPLISFLLFPLDPLQLPQLLLTHTQLSLLAL